VYGCLAHQFISVAIGTTVAAAAGHRGVTCSSQVA